MAPPYTLRCGCVLHKGHREWCAIHKERRGFDVLDPARLMFLADWISRRNVAALADMPDELRRIAREVAKP